MTALLIPMGIGFLTASPLSFGLSRAFDRPESEQPAISFRILGSASVLLSAAFFLARIMTL